MPFTPDLRTGDDLVIDTKFRCSWLAGRYRIAACDPVPGGIAYRLVPVTPSGADDEGPRSNWEIRIEQIDPLLLP